MNAPLLAGTEPISGGKIPSEEASHAAETLSETVEATPPAPKDTEKLEAAAAAPGGGFEIAIDPNSVQPQYIGDDARLTQLRDIHTLFRKWARGSSGSGTRISEETLQFLPEISRAVIQLFQEMQRQNERLQGAQETRLAERRQMEANISSLRAENKMFQDAKEKSKYEIDVLKRDISKVKELYASTKAQKDRLEEQPNEIEARAASDRSPEGSSNKRRHQT